MPEVVLEVESLSCGYNGLPAIRDIDLTVSAGEIVSILGSNGAGKTTTLLALAGLLPVLSGTVRALGEDVDRRRPHTVARRGVRLVPDDRGLFPSMTVREHLRLASTRPNRSREDAVLERFPALVPLRGRTVGLLSGGEQQMLAIGRALMAKPTVLLLDEPSMGLSPILVEQIFSIVKDINQQGTTVLLVEQNALMALAIANRGYVLQTGQIVLADDAKALLTNETVRKAYLGEE